MELANIVLEYLKVILSIQMVVGAVVAIFFVSFKAEIRSLFSRIASIKWGLAELSTPQPPSETLPKDEIISPSFDSKQEMPTLPVGLTLSPDDKLRLEQSFLAERARAHLWEYRYLNYFFVPNTQRVLDWLASLQAPPTFTMYDAWWQATITSAEQRRIIINALESHNLVFYNGELIEVTPKGREYIQWRGPLMQPAPSSNPTTKGS